MRLRLTLLTCGRCGKPRGRHHVCRGGRKRRDRVRLSLKFRCPACGRETPNPFRHTCAIRTDWAKQRRKAARAEKARKRRERRRQVKAQAAKRRRAAARERRARAAAEAKARKPRASPHNPRNCDDEECQRYPCRLYRDGFADGLVAASAEGDGEL